MSERTPFNPTNKPSLSFSDMNGLLKRQRSDLESKIRNIHFLHSVEKVNLIDEYDPKCWVCQKESALIADLKQTLAEHRRQGILENELQLLNSSFQKWIRSLEAGHNNCSTKATSIAKNLKQKLMHRSSTSSLPSKVNGNDDDLMDFTI